jgi:predicted ATPase
MIASVTFRNFKALRNARLDMGPFNLVIGPNGSGKTSLIEAILRLRTLAALPLASMNGRDPRKDGPEIVFRFAAPHDAVSARLSCVSDLRCDLLRVESPSPGAWESARTELLRIRNHLFDPYAMAGAAPRSKDADLATNGSNLGAVLAVLRDDHPEAYARVVGEFRRIMPEFLGIELAGAEGGGVSLGFDLGAAEGVIGADNISQGTLYLLALLTLSFHPRPPSVLCIEEIDRGIHPRMLREVRDALYRLSHPRASGETRAPVQVVATTQSPYMLDQFRDHPEDVVITTKTGRAAAFSRLSERAELMDLLRDGPLGDLWYSGVLSGVPEENPEAGADPR